jgi:hypothetical protein
VPAEQWQDLKNAQGHWPWFPYLLVKLADDHPLALPNETKWPRAVEDLPDEIRVRLIKANVDFEKTLQPLQNQYPALVAKIADLVNRNEPTPLRWDLWPTKTQQLSSPVRTFLEKELQNLLTAEEKEKLKNAEGKWPEFPVMLQELARSHQLKIPWQTFPPPQAKFCDYYRLKKGPAAEKVLPQVGGE